MLCESGEEITIHEFFYSLYDALDVAGSLEGLRLSDRLDVNVTILLNCVNDDAMESICGSRS